MPHTTTNSVLHPSNRHTFVQLLALYHDAFPPEERKPPETLHQMLASPHYRFWSTQRDQHLLAFAIVHISSVCDVVLLEYMAVHPAHRGQGLGRRLLQSLLYETTLPVLIEVESDTPASSEQSPRTKRKQFYRSLGAREIAGLRYLMPQVSTGTPPPMDLLVVFPNPRQSLTKSSLLSWLTSLYTEVYAQSAADARLTAMLATLPDEIPLL